MGDRMSEHRSNSEAFQRLISAQPTFQVADWRSFARSTLRQLQEAPNANRFFLANKIALTSEVFQVNNLRESLARASSMTTQFPDTEIEVAWAAEAHSEHRAERAETRGFVVHPKPAALQALLRLCKTFPTLEHLRSALCATGAITTIETSDNALISPVKNLLQSLEAFGVSASELPYAACEHDCVQDRKDDIQDLWGTFSTRLQVALETNRPIVIVAASVGHLPRALRELSPAAVRLAPLDAEVLLEHLHYCRSFTDRHAEAYVPLDLPPDTRLESMSMSDLALALRAPTAPAVIRQIKGRLVPAKPEGAPRLEKFPMMPELQTAIDQILRDLRDWRAGRIPWRDVTRGLLLVGPPGSGKTEIARLLSNEAGISLHATSVASWHASGDRYSGFMRSMSGFFARAVTSSPSIVFIDELDAIGDRARAHDHNSSYTDGVVTALLEQLDGVASLEGVIVLAATNHLGKIDAAIRRPGRFDRIITLRNPTPDLMPKVFAYHVGEDVGASELCAVAAQSAGMSGADVAGVVRAARAIARREQRRLTKNDLEQALAHIRRPMSAQMRERIAIHEAGHAIVAAACNLGQPEMIAITDGAGVMQHSWTDLEGDEATFTNYITLLLAGREAERLLLGDISAGAGGAEESDLARASAIAAAMEVSFGLGSDGPLWRSTRQNAVAQLSGDVALRKSVQARLGFAEDRAQRVLKVNRLPLKQLAECLVKASVVYGSDLASLLSSVPPFERIGAPNLSE